MNKLSKILLPGIYIGLVLVICLCSFLVIKGVDNYLVDKPTYDYAVDGLLDGDISPVNLEQSDNIIKPYTEENIKIKRYFYDKTSTQENNQKSIIEYNNTYLMNKGIDYTYNNQFDIVSIFDGIVTKIENDEIYGTIVTIKHTDNFYSIYYNLDNVTLSEGYKISKGEIVGVSSLSKIDDDKTYMLHIEIKYKNENINPEKVYDNDIENYQ